MKYVRSKYSVEERIKLCLSKYVLSYQGKNVGKKVSRSLSNYIKSNWHTIISRIFLIISKATIGNQYDKSIKSILGHIQEHYSGILNNITLRNIINFCNSKEPVGHFPISRLVRIQWNAVFTSWHINVKMAYKCRRQSYILCIRLDFYHSTVLVRVLSEIDPSQKCIYICHCPCQHLHICVRTLTPLEVADKFVWRIYSLK